MIIIYIVSLFNVISPNYNKTITEKGRMTLLLRTFFVYGTLMTGCTNHHVIGTEAIERIVRAKMHNVDLYMYDKSYFPCMIAGQGEVTGELVTIKEHAFEKIIARMDRLEGYISPNNPKNFYDRIIMQAEDDHGEIVEAYCYVYNTANGQLGEKIADGDFKCYVRTRGK